MANKGELTVINYFKELGLEAIKINEKSTKTPDFKICEGGSLLFYCEEKTIEEDDFIVNDGITEVYDKSSTKLSSRINTAIKQFEAVNSIYKYPNVLAFNNEDPLINPNDLFVATSKHAMTDAGKASRMLNSLGRIEGKLPTVDLFLWFERGEIVNWIWANYVQEHTLKLKSLLKEN